MREHALDPAARLDAVASIVHRLAVLLSAGVVPSAAWGYLARGSEDHIVRSVGDTAPDGTPLAGSLLAAVEQIEGEDEHAWRGLAAAMHIATEAGASLAPSLRQFAASLRDLAQTRRELSVALAAPAATARMVMALPAIGVLFGLALGFNTLGTLFATVPGWICLVAGIALMAAARLWNRRLVARAQPAILTPGLGLDLMAIAVSGGTSLDRAQVLVETVCIQYGLPDDGSADAITATLSLSREAGVPAAELLRSEAEQSRRTARSEGQKAAATLAVTLMLPLGVCILPAFMLLGVAPLLISIVSSTVSLV